MRLSVTLIKESLDAAANKGKWMDLLKPVNRKRLFICMLAKFFLQATGSLRYFREEDMQADRSGAQVKISHHATEPTLFAVLARSILSTTV